jgi:hypothetical protein
LGNEEMPMPTQTIFVVAVIVAVFIGFAATLAWTDYSTGKVRRDQPAE